MERRIVCAAIKLESGVRILGVRHYDSLMHSHIPEYYPRNKIVQGFIDNLGNFLTRTEAWKIAELANQIAKRCGGDTADGGTLFSENLY